jgi:hypothetical protein
LRSCAAADLLLCLLLLLLLLLLVLLPFELELLAAAALPVASEANPAPAMGRFDQEHAQQHGHQCTCISHHIFGWHTSKSNPQPVEPAGKQVLAAPST